MKGRVYVPLENLNSAEVNKLHLDEVRCFFMGSLLL